jgi:hypothetical protein
MPPVVTVTVTTQNFPLTATAGKTGKPKLLEPQPPNPASQAAIKTLLDVWHLEFGVSRGDRNFLFLVMDGAPMEEVIKLSEKWPAMYDWALPLRFRLHELINELKDAFGTHWKPFLKPLAKCNGWTKDAVGLEKGANTHKRFEFIRLVYEALTEVPDGLF